VGVAEPQGDPRAAQDRPWEPVPAVQPVAQAAQRRHRPRSVHQRGRDSDVPDGHGQAAQHACDVPEPGQRRGQLRPAPDKDVREHPGAAPAKVAGPVQRHVRRVHAAQRSRGAAGGPRRCRAAQRPVRDPLLHGPQRKLVRAGLVALCPVHGQHCQALPGRARPRAPHHAHSHQRRDVPGHHRAPVRGVQRHGREVYDVLLRLADLRDPPRAGHLRVAARDRGGADVAAAGQARARQRHGQDGRPVPNAPQQVVFRAVQPAVQPVQGGHDAQADGRRVRARVKHAHLPVLPHRLQGPAGEPVSAARRRALEPGRGAGPAPPVAARQRPQRRAVDIPALSARRGRRAVVHHRPGRQGDEAAHAAVCIPDQQPQLPGAGAAGHHVRRRRRLAVAG
ncbi:hypothetical protein IWQ57_006386, partial [Coemansia nantahalensis]